MTDKKTLSRRLRDRRVELRLSVKDVAFHLQVAESTYREWEYGRSIRGELHYERLASVFQMTVYELITGRKPQQQKLEKALTLIEDGLRLLRESELA